jgi:hypothetical protein
MAKFFLETRIELTITQSAMEASLGLNTSSRFDPYFSYHTQYMDLPAFNVAMSSRFPYITFRYRGGSKQSSLISFVVNINYGQ